MRRKQVFRNARARATIIVFEIILILVFFLIVGCKHDPSSRRVCA